MDTSCLLSEIETLIDSNIYFNSEMQLKRFASIHTRAAAKRATLEAVSLDGMLRCSSKSRLSRDDELHKLSAN